MRRIELESTRKLIERGARPDRDKETLPAIRRERRRSSDMRSRSSSSRRTKRISSRSTARSTRASRSSTRRWTTLQQGVPARDRHQSRSRSRTAIRRSSTTEKSLMSMMEQEKQKAIELSKIEVEYRPLRARRRGERQGLRAHRQAPEGDRPHRPDADRTTSACSSARSCRAPRSSPKPVQNLMIALLCGLGLGIALAFAIETLDNTLKTQVDVEHFLGVPVLGLIPIIGQGKLDQKARTRTATRRATARSRPGRVPRAAIAGGRVLPVHPHEHPVHVARPADPDDGRSPARARRKARPRPPSTSAIAMAEAGGRVLIDRHRHAPAAAAPLVRGAEPGGDLDGDPGEHDARGGDQAHRRSRTWTCFPAAPFRPTRRSCCTPSASRRCSTTARRATSASSWIRRPRRR